MGKRPTRSSSPGKIDALGDAIHHVHAKDTYSNDGVLNVTGRLETIGHEKVKERAWSYITLGTGHGERRWRQFCYRLRLNGYDAWLSIEHEDTAKWYALLATRVASGTSKL